MDYKEPKTRTETKKQGKKDKGPYSAKHIRAVEKATGCTGTTCPVGQATTRKKR